MYTGSTPDWLARLTNRADIKLYSIFPGNIKSTEKNTVTFDGVISSIICIERMDHQNTLIGVPFGEVWEAVSKIDFSSWSIDDTPFDIHGAHYLKLNYTTTTTVKDVKHTRSGKKSEYVQKSIACTCRFPLNNQAYRILVDSSFLHIGPYDKNHALVENQTQITVNKQLEEICEPSHR